MEYSSGEGEKGKVSPGSDGRVSDLFFGTSGEVTSEVAPSVPWFRLWALVSDETGRPSHTCPTYFVH